MFSVVYYGFLNKANEQHVDISLEINRTLISLSIQYEK